MRPLILLVLVVAAIALTAITAHAQTPEYSHRLAEPAYIVIWDEEEIICNEREGTQAHVVECMTLERYRNR